MPPKTERRFFTYKVFNGRYRHPEGILDLDVKVEYRKNRLDHVEVYLQHVSVEHQPIIKHKVAKAVSKFLQKPNQPEALKSLLPSMARRVSKSLEQAGLGKLNVTVQVERKKPSIK